MFEAHDHDTEPAAPAGELAASCVTAALDALTAAAALPVDALDGSQLRHMTVQLETLRRLLDATECHTLATLDDQGLTEVTTGHRVSTWLAHAAKVPAGIARARLALANRLATDPALAPVADALTQGRIGTEHARALTTAINERNSDALAPILEDLIDASTAMIFTRWRQHVDTLAAVADPDGPHDPDGDLLANTLTLSPSDRFMLLRGELAGEHAITVADALDAIADELFHQFTRDAEATNGAITVPPRSTLVALALEEACRRALAIDTATSAPARTDATLTLHGTLHPHHTPGASSCNCGSDVGTDGAHLDIWALHHRLLGALPLDTIPTLLCDAAFAAVVLDSLGVPTDLGRDHRHPTPAQRRALHARDGGCAFPGCDAHPRWLDAHHIRHWSRGGRTELDNLVLLCRRHHRIAHRNGWTLTLTEDHWTRWTATNGHTFHGQRHHRQRAGPAPG